MDERIAALREKISKFMNYADEVIKMPEANLNKGYLEAKKLMISNMWNKIDTTYDAITEEADDKVAASLAYLEKDYDAAFKILDKVAIRIQNKLEKFTPQAAPLNLPENIVLNEKPNIKLKAMDIPIFTGDYSKWISFRSMLDSLVHDKEYKDVEKIHYLKSCLDGEAERLISQYDITEESYTPAYEALVERYHNEAILIDTHIFDILSQPNLSTESGNDLKEMMDVTTVNLQALKTLKVETGTWDPILLLLLVQKLDAATRRLWEQNLKPKTRPTMKEFLNFLKERFHALGCQQKFSFSINPTTNNQPAKNVSSFRNNNFRRNNAQFSPRVHQNFHTSTDRQGRCPFRCEESHEAIKCDRFLKADVFTKQDLVTCAKLCKNCLKPHGGRCSMQPGCRSCRSYHHDLLHPTSANNSNVTPQSDSNGSNVTRSSYHIKNNPSFRMTIEGPVTPKITQPLPSTLVVRKKWEHINNLPLADPQFNVPTKIDLLLGSAVYGYLMLPGLIKSTPEEPVARNTEFGWILSGPVRSTAKPLHVMTLHLKVNLDDQLNRFFEQEEVSKERLLPKEEVECEKFYAETYKRNADGRFVVALPFKGDPASLGSSKGQAISRLMKLEKRFNKDGQLKEEYSTILREYDQLGHTTNLGALKTTNAIDQSYYLPHHAVFKPESTSTKTRIVFDASAKGTGGKSLNDLLMTGPTLQVELISILLRWRPHRFIFAAHIKKMYRQVEVREQDRKYQKCLFREEESGKIYEHQHNMVTFGVTSATYLAVKSLQQLAHEERRTFPQASAVVRRDFYMDDGMSGADTEQMCVKLCKDVKELLARGKFELSKFITNSKEVLESIPEKDREVNLPLEIDLSNIVKTLGVHYHPSLDEFQFKVNLKSLEGWPTKRTFLSEASKLYDPLGWLAPVVIRTKILFQGLWEARLAWDDKLPEHIAEAWIKFRKELKSLEELRIGRWIGKGCETKGFQLHGFSDSSELAYSAVVYARVVDYDGTIHVTLLASKTRVAPLKKETLPRLELCGLVLLVNLMATVQRAVVADANMHAWTDSMVVLGWLNTNPAKLKTYVANRVVEVNNFLNGSQCHHIEGKKNPADCASRGLNPSELKDHELWWKGPDCLKESRESWHQSIEIPPVTLELKTKTLSTHVNGLEGNWEQLLDKYSSLNRLLRIVAICLKFLDNSRRDKSARITALCLTFVNKVRARKSKPQLFITTEEIQRTEIVLVKLNQNQDFSKEIRSLVGRENVSKKSKIITLNPFLDREGCLRIGGRLIEANVPYERKHPLILAPGKLAKLIIADRHERTLHGGIKLTINMIRENYWILNLRSQTKLHIWKCVKCCRFRKEASNQIMADLPSARVNVSSPFSFTGLDYAGPYDIKASNVRSLPIRIKPTVVNGEVIKSVPRVPIYEGYIVLFVCLATKAVHLEVDFLNVVFLNATTFVGAKYVLAPEPEDSLLDFNKINEHTIRNGTDWKFIPPRAPHHGGVWEAGIKSMKHHLKRIIGTNVLTFEEMSTVTAKIEACLNSRPLCPVSDDPDDFETLTPGHFLIGRPMLARPERTSNSKNVGMRNRWRLIQRIQQDFWKSWSNEYLNELQLRQKWNSPTRNFEEGDIVLVKEDNIAPLKWPLARIVKVHPSKDENVRSVTVKMNGENGKLNELVRPIVKLRLLPTEGDKDNNTRLNN